MSPIVTFIDTKGTRHEGVDLPASLMKAGVSRRQQEAYLVSSGQLPGEGELPTMQEPAEIVQATVDAAALQQVEARLSRLERQPAPILPSEQALSQWAMAAQRIGTSHQELAAAQEQTITAVEATAAAADARLGELDAKQQALASTISDALSQAQEATAQAVVNLEQQGAAALSDIEEEALSKAAEIARQQIGPQGLAGASTVISLEDPLEVSIDSFSARWLSRDLIDGDGVLVIKPDQILVRRWVGGTWREGPAIQPKVEVRDVRVQALNTGNTVFAGGSGSGSGGGSSRGTDPLTTRSIAGAGGASTPIGDSLRWSIPLKAKGLPTPSSCKVAVQLTAADGAQAGKNLFVLAGLLYEPSGGGLVSTRFTEFSSLGDLEPNLSVGFNVQIQTAGGPPAGISVSVPAGTNETNVFLTIDGNSTGATRFFVAGSIEWLLPQPAVPDLVGGSLEPAWKV